MLEPPTRITKQKLVTDFWNIKKSTRPKIKQRIPASRKAGVGPQCLLVEGISPQIPIATKTKYPSESRLSFTDVPVEIVASSFALLPDSDLINCAHVGHNLRAISCDVYFRRHKIVARTPAHTTIKLEGEKPRILVQMFLSTALFIGPDQEIEVLCDFTHLIHFYSQICRFCTSRHVTSFTLQYENGAETAFGQPITSLALLKVLGSLGPRCTSINISPQSHRPGTHRPYMSDPLHGNQDAASPISIPHEILFQVRETMQTVEELSIPLSLFTVTGPCPFSTLLLGGPAVLAFTLHISSDQVPFNVVMGRLNFPKLTAIYIYSCGDSTISLDDRMMRLHPNLEWVTLCKFISNAKATGLMRPTSTNSTPSQLEAGDSPAMLRLPPSVKHATISESYRGWRIDYPLPRLTELSIHPAFSTPDPEHVMFCDVVATMAATIQGADPTLLHENFLLSIQMPIRLGQHIRYHLDKASCCCRCLESPLPSLVLHGFKTLYLTLTTRIEGTDLDGLAIYLSHWLRLFPDLIILHIDDIVLSKLPTQPRNSALKIIGALASTCKQLKTFQFFQDVWNLEPDGRWRS